MCTGNCLWISPVFSWIFHLAWIEKRVIHLDFCNMVFSILYNNLWLFECSSFWVGCVWSITCLFPHSYFSLYRCIPSFCCTFYSFEFPYFLWQHAEGANDHIFLVKAHRTSLMKSFCCLNPLNLSPCNKFTWNLISF